MDISTNPFAVLTLISAPAVLTNASCVLLFGTGNRYGRAIDRVHQLSELIERLGDADRGELDLRIRQLDAAETRTSLIVRALTCFYTAVAGFVTSTLISLLGAVLVSARLGPGVSLCFAVAAAAGTVGVVSMVAGALMLVRETRYSFRILREESKFLTHRARQRVLPHSELSTAPYPEMKPFEQPE
jgi:hypothetical protein